MRLLLLILAITFTTSGFSQILIKNVTLIDVENKKLLPGYSVVVDNGRIAAMGKDIRYKLPAGTQVIDGTGKFLAPGWVDAHVHFFQTGSVYTRPDAIDLRKFKTHSEEIKWAHDNMEQFLRGYTSAGITSVVDVGSTISFLRQRDSFRTKPYAPAVFMTGPLLTTWEPQQFKNLKEDAPFFEMKSADDGRKYVREQLPFKPDFIKIWFIVTGKNTDSSARASMPLISAVIDEAHKNGLRVAVHATERITAQLSVEAGADLLVHGIEDEPVTEAFVKLLREKKTVMTPTLVVKGNYYEVFGQTYIPKPWDFLYANATPLNSVIDMRHFTDTTLTSRYKAFVNQNKIQSQQEDALLLANTKKLLDGGVIMATGTDAGNIGTQHASSFFDELIAMRTAGFDMWQLLQSSTINGAKAIGKDSVFGSIKVGKIADLVLLRKNPVESIDNWSSIEFVFNKGIAFKPDSLLSHTPEMLAEQQLLGYNAHNLDAFLAPYAEDVEVFNFPSNPIITGKAEMRKTYEFIEKTPGLYCRILKRIVQGNTVIDHEEVYGFGDKPFYGVAIYQIENGKIRRVYFL